MTSTTEIYPYWLTLYLSGDLPILIFTVGGGLCFAAGRAVILDEVGHRIVEVRVPLRRLVRRGLVVVRQRAAERLREADELLAEHAVDRRRDLGNLEAHIAADDIVEADCRARTGLLDPDRQRAGEIGRAPV